MGFIHRFVFSLLCRLIRMGLSLRYRITLKGFDNVLSLTGSKSGILFLPNHPAEVDPILLIAILGPYFQPRGVVVEHFYRLKGFQKILDFCRVVPVPSMDEKANKWKKKELETTLAYIQKKITEGDHFIIYPAGRLKRTGKETIGGASFVHDILQGTEEIPCVLIRTVGLWGSSFSVARTGSSPKFGPTLARALLMLFKNGIFFSPRRALTIEFSVNPPLPKRKERLEFNRSLESWYNQYQEQEEEPLSLTPESLWNKEVQIFHPECVESFLEEEKELIVSPIIEAEVLSYLADLSKVPKESITWNAQLSLDLGLDSLDIAEIHAFLDKKYDAAQIPLGELRKVRDVLRAIVEEKTHTKERVVEKMPPLGWFEARQRKAPIFGEGSVIPEVFLWNSRRMRSYIACADGISQVLSYKKLEMGVLVLAEEFRKLPGEKIGVLLPSSCGTYSVILGLLLAGKVPVMLNWTLGQKALTHIAALGGFAIALTSKRFLDRIHLEDLGGVENTFVFLEDIKETISWKKKFVGFFRSLCSVKSILSHFNVDKDPSKIAVLLFTSGSESLPKAVPLSHENLLANQREVLVHARVRENDIMYGVLPPFHSFGFSLTGLLPLLCGLKVYYAPDPTDSLSMAADIERMHINILCLAPSFISALFSVASLQQLSSLALIVSGAEKPSFALSLFIKEHLPNTEWMEGYGITECSPVVTVGIRGENNNGVGKPLANVELKIVEVNSLEDSLALGEDGEICIRGPNVFAGYLGGGSDPFLSLDGQQWYRSGDLGHIDFEGNLHIVERLKRTVKIGGEMISLGAVEQELQKIVIEKGLCQIEKEGPILAVIPLGKETVELALCTTFPVSLEEINRSLRESGITRLVKIARIIEVAEIPVMGTGKMNYRELKEKLGVF